MAWTRSGSQYVRLREHAGSLAASPWLEVVCNCVWDVQMSMHGGKVQRTLCTCLREHTASVCNCGGVAAFAGMCMGVQRCCKKLVQCTDSCTKAGTTMHVHQQLRQVNDNNPARCHSAQSPAWRAYGIGLCLGRLALFLCSRGHVAWLWLAMCPCMGFRMGPSICAKPVSYAVLLFTHAVHIPTQMLECVHIPSHVSWAAAGGKHCTFTREKAPH